MDVYNNTSTIFIDYGGRIVGLGGRELLNHLPRVTRYILDVWGPHIGHWRLVRAKNSASRSIAIVYREETLLKIILTVHPNNGRHVTPYSLFMCPPPMKTYTSSISCIQLGNGEKIH